jgi:hypothetical protein
MGGALYERLNIEPARRTNGVVIFAPEAAIELINEAKRREVQVYGLDAFLLHPKDEVQPESRYDVDVEGRVDAHEVLTDYLSNFVGTSFFFEVALASD